MKALVFDRFGPPEVLQYRTVADPVLSADQALVRTHAIGLNFADVYRRKGTYHLAGVPPFIAGYEGAGVIVGSNVGGFAVGQRVGFADMPHANAELVAVDLEKLIALPDEVSFETAAGALLQGLTAQYLVRDSHPVRADETVVVHAAAGGVGLLLTQWCASLGARVLGLTSTSDKARAVREAGAAATALYASDWVQEVGAFARGGADVVYDSVGATLSRSLAATRTRGHVVFYGMAGGDPPLIDPRMLMDTSKRLSGGDLWNVLTSASERRSRAAELFARILDGSLRLQIDTRWPLAEGARAHERIESRASIGKVLLLP